MWETWSVELGQIIDAGDDVVVFIRERGRSKSGIETDERHAEVYTVKDGKILRRRGFADSNEALEAVGLREPQRHGSTARRQRPSGARGRSSRG